MKKFLNFRLAFILALTFMVATAFATYVFVAENLKFVMFLIFAFVFLVFIVLSFIFKRKVLYFVASIVFFIAFPFGANYLKSKRLNENVKFHEKEIEIQGRIDGSFKFTSSGNLQLTLDDVIILDDKLSEIDGKIVLYVNVKNLDISSIEPGLIVNTKAKFYALSFQDEFLSRTVSLVSKDIVGSAYVSTYNISVTSDDKLSLRDSVRNNVYDLLYNSEIDYADVGYAMMFGDSNYLDVSIKDSFRTTGIAHLLAVSGLHVSLIVLIINFVLRKLKTNSKLIFIINFVILSFYCYLCDFSVSVVRASLMTMFGLYALLRGKAYDGLSSLSLAAIIIMMFNPIKMFNISFVLSFSAVLSIILLSHMFNRLFANLLYHQLSSAIALNISVQLGLVITNLYYFEKFPVLGIIANLVAVPLASVAFMILFAGVLVSSVFPFMSFIFSGFEWLIRIVVKFNEWICLVGKVLTISGVTWISVVTMFLFVFVISDYMFARKKQKFLLSNLFLVLLLSFCLIFT